MNVFAYGTLMFPEVWRRIVGQERSGKKARVEGFALYRVQNAVFPGMIHEAGAEVWGVVFEDIDEETLFELDAYESDFYKREVVEAVAADGRTYDCEAFIVPQSHRAALTEQPWDAESFEKNDLQAYLDGH
ncbi:MAG: gamma-glutamylcyclotransferase family protein [Planctomycetota bacterium]